MEAEVEVERMAGHRGARPGEVGTNPEFKGMERETGREPATPCLEGRYLHFHCPQAAKPLQSSISHRSTLYGRKHGSCQGFRRSPATACAHILTEEAP